MKKITLAWLSHIDSYALYIDDKIVTKDEPDLNGAECVLKMLQRAGILEFKSVQLHEEDMEDGFPPDFLPNK